MAGESDPRFADLEEGMEIGKLPGFKVVRREGDESDQVALNALLKEHDRATRPEEQTGEA